MLLPQAKMKTFWSQYQALQNSSVLTVARMTRLSLELTLTVPASHHPGGSSPGKTSVRSMTLLVTLLHSPPFITTMASRVPLLTCLPQQELCNWEKPLSTAHLTHLSTCLAMTPSATLWSSPSTSQPIRAGSLIPTQTSPDRRYTGILTNYLTINSLLTKHSPMPWLVGTLLNVYLSCQHSYPTF